MDSLRCLYLCYLSLDDPLVRSQVVAYLEGLAARGLIHLLTFDTALSKERRRALRAEMDAREFDGTPAATTSGRLCRQPRSTPSPVLWRRSGSCDAIGSMRSMPATTFPRRWR